MAEPESKTVGEDALHDVTFMECDTCRAKPGMPQLCGGCLHNRAIIGELKKAIRALLGKRDVT